MPEEVKSALSIDESTEVNEESLGSSFGVGIHDNVQLVKIEYSTPDVPEKAKWKESLDFTFESTVKSVDKDSNGNVIRDEAGVPVVISKAGDRITSKQFYDLDATDVAKNKNTMSRIKHIMTKFMESNEAVVSGADFKILSAKVIKSLSGKTEGVKLRLKVIKGNNNFGTIAQYTPFVEKMSAPISQLKLSLKEREGQKATSLSDMAGGDQEIKIPGVD